MEIVAKHLQALRRARKLSRLAVAEAVRISERSYQRYENDEREPSLPLFLALADFYGVTLDQLAGRDPLPEQEG